MSRCRASLACWISLATIAAADPGVRHHTTALGSRQLVRSVVEGPPAVRPASVQPPGVTGRAGQILWTVLEPDATIDREGIAVSGDGTALVGGWWLNDEYVALYPMAGGGTPAWSYLLNPASNFFAPVDVGTSTAVIAGTTDAEPLYQWGPASSTPDYTHPWTSPQVGSHAAVAADGAFIAGSSKDSTGAAAVEVYDAVTGTQRWRLGTVPTDAQGLDISRDGTRLAGNEYGMVNVWDAATGAPLAGFALPGGTQTISRLSQDGAYLVFGNFNGIVHCYRWDSGTTSYVVAWSYPTGDDWITAVDISDDGSTVVAGTLNFTTPYTGSVHVIDRATGGLLWSDTSYGDYVQSVALSQDGSRIVAGSWGRYAGTQGNIVAVYDRTSNIPVFSIPDDSIPNVGTAFAASISDDGQYVGAGGKEVHARDLGNGGWIIAAYVPVVIPLIDDVCPEALRRGSVDVPVRISGQNFDPAAVVAVAPAGVTLSGVTVVSSTLITARATVPAASATGPYDLSVTNPDGRGATAVAALTVTARAADVLAGPGPGTAQAPRVRGFLATGTAIGTVDFLAYGSTGYGVNVASADVNGGSLATGPGDILTGPGPGPGSIYGPQVRAFDRAGAPMAKVNFYAYGTLRYGVHVAAADLECDGYDEILSGAGPGAVFGPHVRGWNFDNATLGPAKNCSFYAYGTLKYGVHPESGDADRDSFDEILTAPGPGLVFASHVRGWNHDGTSVTALARINFTAFGTSRYGASVAGSDADNDGYPELIVGIGPAPSHAAQLAGFNLDAGTLGPLAGYSATATAGTLFGTTFVRSGDTDGSGDEEITSGAGPDPAAAADVVIVDYVGGAASVGTPFTAFTPPGYGIKAAPADLGY